MNNDNKQNSILRIWPWPLTLTSISFKWTNDFMSKDCSSLRLIPYEFIQHIAFRKFSKGNNSNKMSFDHSSQIKQIIFKSRQTIWWKQFVKIFYRFRDIAITRKGGRGEITPIRISVLSHRVSFETPITVQHHRPKIHLICCKTKTKKKKWKDLIIEAVF